MLQKAQTAAKNLQQNAAASVAKMLNDTENYYARNLQSIKTVKGKLSTTVAASNKSAVSGKNPLDI